MQSQEYSDQEQSQDVSNEQSAHGEPGVQATQPIEVYHPYEEGYSNRNAQELWPRAGQKLQPDFKSHRGSATGIGNGRNSAFLLLLVLLICVIFIAGSLFGLLLSWLGLLLITVLVLVGAVMLIVNWRSVSIPMPPRTFPIMEHAQVDLKNHAGTIILRRGEENIINVKALKHARGLRTNLEQLQINYAQNGDHLTISSPPAWSFFPFSIKYIDFEITVPANCDIQLSNGSGVVALQGTSGNMQIHTGSGNIEGRDLQGQIELKTGSGSIDVGNLAGQISLKTGSGSVEAFRLQGPVALNTGSGSISMSQSELHDSSKIVTGSGSISFQGLLDPQSNNQFTTGSGTISFILPPDSMFDLDAKTGSGGVRNEFGNQIVGNTPRARLKLRTGSGTIRLSRSYPSGDSKPF